MTKPIILLILKALEGRGAERMVTTLAHAYLAMDYRIHVLCLEDTQDMSLDPRVQHHVVAYSQPHNNDSSEFEPESGQAVAYRRLAKQIDDHVLANIGVPDLILVNIYKLNWIMAYSQLPNIVNVLHTALSRQFQDQLATMPAQTIAHLKRVYGAHPCSCVSEGARQDLLALIGNSVNSTNLNRTTTIYNPCDADEIRKAATQLLSIEQFGLINKGYIVHVASFDTMKGHRDLLQAYAKTERKLPLVLVGKGKLEDEMKQLAIQLNIGDCVHFLGFQANPYPLIAAAALLVLTSKFEGFGYVIVEAQALDVPVISTDCPFGPRELLPESNLIPVGDIDGLAMLMSQAIENLNHYKVPLNQQLLPNCIARQYLEFGQVLDLGSNINKDY
ncbi:glycosyltransferase [Psychrobacter sp. LV10R520-6]|uniref:glycosyltransferase n=1 Tax=Psychrobacter sp. LV10R520-6 TaxID=1415574 RepID=UPI0024CA6F04|nr:glycosyltransferase [Psychrobacter sp. LV10R520-6]SNT69959.1 Glycosyltransferase involved in cell wall bisynthesis [Psychrobacter sp. LV10R520-6]